MAGKTKEIHVLCQKYLFKKSAMLIFGFVVDTNQDGFVPSKHWQGPTPPPGSPEPYSPGRRLSTVTVGAECFKLAIWLNCAAPYVKFLNSEYIGTLQLQTTSHTGYTGTQLRLQTTSLTGYTGTQLRLQTISNRGSHLALRLNCTRYYI